jgi:glutathione S-transferase
LLKVWGRRSSLNVQKVLWLVGELGLDHEHIPAGGEFGGLSTPEFRTLNPHGKVPVVEDGDVAVWESHSILRYLAARHGAPRFWAKDPAVRSQSDRWMDWFATTLQQPFLGGLFWGYYRTAPEQRNWPAIERNIKTCAHLFGFLERQLEGREFLCGDALSLGDFPAGAALYRYFEMDLPRPPLPNVGAWYARLQARPAYREHVMLPFDELQGQPGP